MSLNIEAQSATKEQESSQGVPALSVVVPIGPDEPQELEVFAGFGFLPKGTEIILAGTHGRSFAWIDGLHRHYPDLSIRCLLSEPGRARQMNSGAIAATGRWLWFLHADSQFGVGQLTALRHSTAKSPEAILYFNLSFLNDGPFLMPLNSIGVWLRSHILSLPFGDQGLCISAQGYRRLGGFDEGVAIGEDFFFVRAARAAGMKVACTGSTIKTSARKYQTKGWLTTTRQHLSWTFRQLLPIIRESRKLR